MTRAFGLDTPASSFEAIKEGAGRFKREPLDAWLACCCALHAWHLSEQVPALGEPPSDEPKSRYRKSRYRIACPALGHLQDICNTFKHTNLTYQPRIESAEFEDGEFDPRDFDPHDFYTPRLAVKLPDGASVLFDDILDEAMDYWATLLGENLDEADASSE